jgi:argininosuccinate lyase
VNAASCAAAARDPLLLATDLADYLVRKGMPFRQAHHVVGAVVGVAEKTGKPLDQFTVADFQSVDPTFGNDVTAVFNLQAAMQRRQLIGAPGTKEVAKQLKRWGKLLQAPPR